jgi:hypothetical protein
MAAKIAKPMEMKQYSGFVFVLLWKDNLIKNLMDPAGFYMSDPWLKPYIDIIDRRIDRCRIRE